MKAKEVLKILGISRPTLSKYVKEGKIRFTELSKNFYDYNEDDVRKLTSNFSKINIDRVNITYSRVSLNKQKNDLISQSNRLYNYSISNGFKIDKQYTEIKSGMNFNNRKELDKIIDDVVNFKIDKLIIENKDRLCRFGFELIEKIFNIFGTEIIVVSNTENKTYEQELTDDLISIIHYFSMKSYSNRRKLNKIEKELKSDKK